LKKSKPIDVEEYIAKCPKEAHGDLAKIRAAIQSSAPGATERGDAQLGDEVRYFVHHLPRVLTDRERLAVEIIQHVTGKKPDPTREGERIRDRVIERTR
jgi:hypothetical protein